MSEFRLPIWSGLLLIIPITVGAAQAQSPQNTPHNDGTPQSYCPPAGTVVEYDSGLIRAHHGPLPHRPSICQSRVRKNVIDQSLFNLTFMLVSQSRIIEGQERVLADAEAFMPDLFPLHVGARVQGRIRFSNTQIATNTITVLREESLTLPAGTFQAWVIQWEDSRRDGAHERRLYWYDRGSGVLLKSQVQVFRGYSTPRLRDFQAVRLSLPGEDPYAPAPVPQ